MDWLIPDSPDRLASMIAERTDRDGPLLATGAPAPSGPDQRRPDPVRPEDEDVAVVSTAGLETAIDLRARDLTVSVGAGARVADLRASLAEEGLWLALGGASLRRSVGGAVAAASPGPWDASYGDLARQLLSCSLVTWRGTSVRWGRAVMKDVAGYGTTRAAAGSFGRLGVLHRAVFRVWPAPASAAAVELGSRRDDALAAAGRLAASDLDARVRPDALRWFRDADADGGDGRLEAWLIGSAASVDDRRDRLAEAADQLGVEPRGTRTGFDPAGDGASGSADEGERRTRISVAVLRPGREAFAPAARRAAEALGGAAAGLTGYPLQGVLRCAYRRRSASGEEEEEEEQRGQPGGEKDGAAGAEEAGRAAGGSAAAPEPLARLLAATGEIPVRIERGSAAELAAVEARRPDAARRLERRVVEALEGRPRHWLSGYL